VDLTLISGGTFSGPVGQLPGLGTVAGLAAAVAGLAAALAFSCTQPGVSYTSSKAVLWPASSVLM
jgi:hypothetical protein